MTVKNMKVQLRRDTASNWTTKNPVLLSGEMGIETDTNKFKFGDGNKTWTQLDYASSGGGSGGDIPTKVSDLENDLGFVTESDVSQSVLSDVLGVEKETDTIIIDKKNYFDLEFSTHTGQYWDFRDYIADPTRTDVEITLKSYAGTCYNPPIEVTPGQKIFWTMYQISTAKNATAAAFIDENNIVVWCNGKVDTTGVYTGETIVPENAKYLCLTTWTDFAKDCNAGYITQETETVTSYPLTSNDGVMANVYAKTEGGLITSNGLKGKLISVLGDSISTQIDKNAVEITITEEDVGVQLNAFLTYYDVQAGLSIAGHQYSSSEIGTQVTFTPTLADVGKKIGLPANYNTNVEKVWWEILEEQTGCEVNPVCWSGSGLGSHEESVPKFKTASAMHTAQLRKLGKRIPGQGSEAALRIPPDVVIIFRGGNDMTHTPYAKITSGYFDNYNWTYPSTDVISGGYGFLEALSLTIKNIREWYPDAQIMIATIEPIKKVNYGHFPMNNGEYSLPQINDALRKAADFFGCHTIDFDKCGITFENIYNSGYATDSATMPIHPTTKGHKLMAAQAIKDITNKLSLNAIF